MEDGTEEPYLVANGWYAGDNIITLNPSHAILKETYYYFKLEPGTYKLKCELTNSKAPFAMILFQGTETVNEIDVNGVEYQVFHKLTTCTLKQIAN
ncbi:hypothetical protein [Clostridium sp.]|uniref:hypothetical protein n=1 Tax=Clostridium sp. TaxID=1506 RepID=UPI003F4165ED